MGSECFKLTQQMKIRALGDLGSCPREVFFFLDPQFWASACVRISLNTLPLSWHDGEKEMGLLHHSLLVDKIPHSPWLSPSLLALRIPDSVRHPSWLPSALPGVPGLCLTLGCPRLPSYERGPLSLVRVIHAHWWWLGEHALQTAKIYKCRQGFGKQWPMGQIQPTAWFCK